MGRGTRASATVTAPTERASAPTQAAKRLRPTDVLPREHDAYLEALNAKHFAADGIGSVFTDCGSVSELVMRAASQPGGLLRDDREALLAAGVSADALRDDCRYLRVPAHGRLGLVSVADLADDEPVHVLRTKPGAPCSLVVSKDHEGEADYGTLIIGPNQGAAGSQASTEEMVYTAHPGPPVRPADSDIWDEGTTLTAAQVRAELGDGIYVQASGDKAEQKLAAGGAESAPISEAQTSTAASAKAALSPVTTTEVNDYQPLDLSARQITFTSASGEEYEIALRGARQLHSLYAEDAEWQKTFAAAQAQLIERGVDADDAKLSAAMYASANDYFATLGGGFDDLDF